jgi:hypothetical protein
MVPKKPSSSSSRAAAPTTSTVPPSQLGLTNGEEVATFQRHQQIALSRANNNARTAAANGRVLVDASSLQLLANHFDHVMAGIQRRADLVSTWQTVFHVSYVYVLLSCLLQLRVRWNIQVLYASWRGRVMHTSQLAMLLKLEASTDRPVSWS